MAHDSGFFNPCIPLFAQRRTHLFLRGRRLPHHVQQSGQVVSFERKQRLPRQPLQPLVPHLAQANHRLDLAEARFDHLPPAQTNRIVLATRRAPIECTATDLALKARANATRLEYGHELSRLIALVQNYRRAQFAHAAINYTDRSFLLRPIRRLRALDIDDEPVSVLRERVRHVTQRLFRELALLLQLRLQVGRALVCGVAARLALIVHL